MAHQPSATTPLSGIKVADFTKMIAGPKAGMLLADMGAEVIKIEGPGQQDPSRFSGTNPGVIYTMSNRNKKSLMVDITTDEGREVAKRLVGSCDILIESGRPGMMDRFGLGYEDLSVENPGLIYASVSGYGSVGPGALRGGVDTIIQAESGVMFNSGEPDGPPVLLGGYMVDETAGLTLTQSILLALFARERSGQGSRVEVSLFETAIYLQSFEIASASLTGQQPARTGNRMNLSAPAGVVETKDGLLVIVVLGDHMFRRLCEVIERPQFIDDERFMTGETRIENHAELLRLIGEAMSSRTSAEWIPLLEAEKMLVGPVQRYAEVLADPQLKALNSLVPATHRGEPLQLVRWPGRLSGHRFPSEVMAPPAAGKHTVEVLRDLGYDSEIIERLLGENVVQTA